MAVINCGACGHPGVHATITMEGWPDRCTGCPQCQKELIRDMNEQVGSNGSSPDRRRG